MEQGSPPGHGWRGQFLKSRVGVGGGGGVFYALPKHIPFFL